MTTARSNMALTSVWIHIARPRPDSSGHRDLKRETGASPEYCPRDISSSKRGAPSSDRDTMYISRYVIPPCVSMDASPVCL